MDKVTFIEVTNSETNEVTEHAIIDRGNGEFTSMLKSTYDAMQAEQSTLGLVNSDKSADPVL
jgi:hypothetical protein